MGFRPGLHFHHKNNNLLKNVANLSHTLWNKLDIKVFYNYLSKSFIAYCNRETFNNLTFYNIISIFVQLFNECLILVVECCRRMCDYQMYCRYCFTLCSGSVLFSSKDDAAWEFRVWGWCSDFSLWNIYIMRKTWFL